MATVSSSIYAQFTPYYLTLDKSVTGSETFYKVEKSSEADKQVLQNITSKGDGVERDVLIIAPEGPGGIVPASVEKKVRELEKEAKELGLKINPKVLLFSEDYIKEAEKITKRYNDALQASMDMSPYSSSYFADDPEAQRLLQEGDRAALVEYLMGKSTQDPEILSEDAKKSVGILQTVKDRFKNQSPEIRNATLATLGLKVLIQGFACYFAIYLADVPLAPSTIMPFVAFNITMTVLINSFIDWYIKVRSVCESKLSNIHDKRYKEYNKMVDNWKRIIDERKSSGTPWVLDAMLYRIVDGGIANIGKGFYKFNKAVVRGDMAFQFGVSLFFLAANWGIVGLSPEFQVMLEGIKGFFGTPNGVVTGISLGIMALYVTLKNVISGIPIDVINSYFNRVGLFKDKTSIWYSLVPEMLWQKDKLASVGLGVLNDVLNVMIMVVGLPAYIIAHLVYPPVKDKEKLDPERAEDLKIKQAITQAKLYPDEKAMYDFLGRQYPEGTEELSYKERIGKMVDASLEKLLSELRNSADPKKYMESKRTFLMGEGDYPGFLWVLISKSYSVQGYEERKAFINTLDVLISYLPEAQAQKGEVVLAREWNEGVKTNLLFNNLKRALDLVYGVKTTETELDKLVLVFLEKEFSEKDKEQLDPDKALISERVFLGTQYENYKDGLWSYLLERFNMATSEQEIVRFRQRLLVTTVICAEKYEVGKKAPLLMEDIYAAAPVYSAEYRLRTESRELDPALEREFEREKDRILKDAMEKEIRETRIRYNYKRPVW